MSNPFSKRRKITHDNDTIHRELLDFDFEKVCLVTLDSTNVYCCLVCGKYFQGRSKSSPAYNHAITMNHHKFLNLTSEKFYNLPEDIEISKSHELQDILEYLNPRYTQRDIDLLPRISFDLNSEKYRVGYVGLNNIKHNDYANVVVQALAHIKPIRDYYLQLPNGNSLNAKFGELVRKIWSPHLFKSHISPQGFITTISEESKRKFTTEKGTPKAFLLWILNKLDGPFQCLRGKIEITSTPIVPHEGNDKVEFVTLESKRKTTESNFWILSVDVPLSLFNSHGDKIEELHLEDLLLKYDGETTTQGPKDIRTYKVTKLPQYLIILYERSKESKAVVKFPEVLEFYGKKYELVSSIRKKETWSITLHAQQEWILIHNLEVKTVSSELLFLDENYIQVWNLVQ